MLARRSRPLCCADSRLDSSPACRRIKWSIGSGIGVGCASDRFECFRLPRFHLRFLAPTRFGSESNRFPFARQGAFWLPPETGGFRFGLVTPLTGSRSARVCVRLGCGFLHRSSAPMPLRRGCPSAPLLICSDRFFAPTASQDNDTGPRRPSVNRLVVSRCSQLGSVAYSDRAFSLSRCLQP